MQMSIVKKKFSNLLLNGLLWSIVALSLGACGQTGELYLPDPYSVDKPPPTSGKRPQNTHKTHETSKQILEKKDD